MSGTSVFSEAHISGLLAPPRVSRNDNLYLPEELQAGDGLVIPFYDEHEDFVRDPSGQPTGELYAQDKVPPRGKIRLKWDNVLKQLKYHGEVWDNKLVDLIKSGKRKFVSLAAAPRDQDEYRGHKVPLGLRFFSASAVSDPGIPETTLNLSEGAKMRVSPPLIESFIQSRYIVMEGNLKVEAELDVDKRSGLDNKDFAWIDPDTGERKLPIHDAAHVRNALSRVNQTQGIPADKKAGVLAKIKRRAKELGVQVSEYSDDQPRDDQGKFTSNGGGGSSDDASAAQFKVTNLGDEPEDRGQWSDDRSSTDTYAQKNFNALDGRSTDQPPTCPHGDGKTFANYSDYNDHIASDHRDKIAPGFVWVKDSVGKWPGAAGVLPDPHAKTEPDVTSVQGGPDSHLTNNLDAGGDYPKGLDKTGPQDASTLKVIPTSPQAMTPPVNYQPGPVITNMPYYGQQSASPTPSVPAQRTPTTNPLMHSSESSANKDGKAVAESFMPEKPVKEGEGDAATAQDKTTKQAASINDQDVKAIGLPKTPFEQAQKIPGVQGEEEEEEEQPADTKVGQAGKPPKPAADMGSSSEEEEEEEEEEDDVAPGYTKEEWSVMSKTERRAAKKLSEKANKIAQSIVQRALEEAGLAKKGQTISSRRESRAGGPDIVQSTMPYDFETSNPETQEQIREVLRVIRGESRYGSAVARVPLMKVPYDAEGRAKLKATIESFNARYQNLVAENITTSTTGAALGVDEMTPALVVPTNIAALVRDTLLFRALPQGVDRARFSTVSVPAAVALTEDTEPSQSSQTLSTVDVTTAPRGLETDISFEAERKVIGPILDAMILANRLSELYDEDSLLIGTGNSYETTTIPSTGGILGTGNTFYGDGTVTSEATVTSTMTLSAKAFDFARSEELKQGYAPDNLVGVFQPNQVYALFNDSSIVRYLQFGINMDQVRSMIGQGIITLLFGIEVRQSTLGATGTGSGAITTYHGWVWKKGLTSCMAASRDVMIETFRDIRKNATVLKSHWDLGIKVVHPNSLIKIITA